MGLWAVVAGCTVDLPCCRQNRVFEASKIALSKKAPHGPNGRDAARVAGTTYIPAHPHHISSLWACVACRLGYRVKRTGLWNGQDVCCWAREVVELTHRRIPVTRRLPPRREPEPVGLRCCQDPYRDSLPSLSSHRAL